jgi:hypothetical protein
MLFYLLLHTGAGAALGLSLILESEQRSISAFFIQ